jgi:transposase-like protein
MNMYFICATNVRHMVKNLLDLQAKFDTEDKCREYLVQQRWNGNPVCPYCSYNRSYVIEHGKRFKCANKECYKKYSVTVGTIFEASNISLKTWFHAMYLITAHKKGVSSVQLAKDLGVTQKSAWFMIHRIRESLREKESKLLSNTVEIDETYVGGKLHNKHRKVRNEARKKGTGYTANMTGVMGMVERKGDLKLKVIGVNNAGVAVKPVIRENISPDAVIITDGFGGYYGLNKEFKQHEVLNHSQDEFVRGEFHTNTIEGFFSFLKRSLYGCYHAVSPKHLQRYCDENAYRYNTRKLHDGFRFQLSLQNIEGRLDYLTLVNGKREENKAQNTQIEG